MDHGAAGKVDRFNLRGRIPHSIHQAIDAPNHVRERKVNDKHPECYEYQDGGKLHTFSDRADDQSGSNNGEH